MFSNIKNVENLFLKDLKVNSLSCIMEHLNKVFALIPLLGAAETTDQI